MEVLEGDRLGFVALVRGGVEVMYQSRASVAKDLPALAEGPYERTGLSLFVQVERLDEVIGAMAGLDLLFPERKTFYGSREIGVRATCGTVVVFAQLGE